MKLGDRRYKSPEQSAVEKAHATLIGRFFGETINNIDNLRVRLYNRGYNLSDSDDVYEFIKADIQGSMPVIEKIYIRSPEEYKKKSYQYLRKYQKKLARQKVSLDIVS